MFKKVTSILKDLVKEEYGADFMVTFSDVIASIVSGSKKVIQSVGGFDAKDYGEISFIPGQLVDFTGFVAKQVALYMRAKAFDMESLERAYELAFHRDNNELIMYLKMESAASCTYTLGLTSIVPTVGLEVYKPSAQGTIKIYNNGDYSNGVGIHIQGCTFTWMLLPNHVVAELPDYEMVCIRLLQAFTRKALQVSNLDTKAEFITAYGKNDLTYSIPFSYEGNIYSKRYDMLHDLMVTISASDDVLDIFNFQGLSDTVSEFMLLVTSVLREKNQSVFPHIYRAIID